MVSFDDCEGNPGALTFMSEACMGGSMSNAFKAESAFSRVVNAGIRGADLYILWNDCCGRDTEFALDIMKNRDIEEIKKHIKGEYGRGTPFEKDGK